LVERVLGDARWADGTEPVAEMTGKLLSKRGQEALSQARKLQTNLVRTLEGLAATGVIAGIDPAAVGRIPLRGLPDADLDSLTDGPGDWLPWWGGIPGLRLKALRKRYARPLGSLIDDYERALSLWLRGTQQQLVAAFESQAEVAREQVRRLSAEPQAEGDGSGETELRNDIRELLGGEQPAKSNGVARPLAAPAEVG
jgi:hypothetical protein